MKTQSCFKTGHWYRIHVIKMIKLHTFLMHILPFILTGHGPDTDPFLCMNIRPLKFCFFLLEPALDACFTGDQEVVCSTSTRLATFFAGD